MEADEEKKRENLKEPEIKILQTKIVESTKMGQRDRKALILLAILIPLFLYLVASTFFKGGRKPEAASPSRETKSAVAAGVSTTTSGQDVSRRSAPENAADSQASEDDRERSPFSLLSERDQKKGLLVVQGVVSNGKDAYAIINQKIVKVGDRLDDNTVKEISSNNVTIESKDGKQLVLNV